MYYNIILLVAVSFLICCDEVAGFMADSKSNSSPSIRTSLTTTTKIPINLKFTTHTSSSSSTSTSLLMSSKFDSKYYIPAEQTARSGDSPSQSRITLSRFVSHKQFTIMKKFISLKTETITII